MLKKTALLPLTLALLLTSARSFAADSLGRLQVTGAGLTSNLGILSGDAMLPFTPPQNGFVYADLMGDKATDGTYQISPGVGFRTIKDNQIFGAYFFADYEETSLNANFWNLSPGVEWMSPHWDAHVNAYFPTKTQQQNGNTDFASNFGIYTYGDPHGYDYDDEYLTPYAVIGNGVDSEVGYSFDTNHDGFRWRAFLGSYYYLAPSDTGVDNITGFTAGISQAISKNATLSLFNSYDNVNCYNIGLSLSFTFGGDSNNYSNDVHDRLLDSVQRHIGIIDTGASNYDQQYYQEDGMANQYSNVRYMTPDGNPGALGTYEDPMPLTQESLDTIGAQDVRIYLQSSDTAYELNNANTSDDGLYVYEGQDFYGRTADYKAPAESDAQPQIEVEGENQNGFVMENTSNSFSDLTIYSSTTGNTGSGIIANNTSNDNQVTLEITNTTISNFNSGVRADNNNSGTMTINTDNAYFINNTVDGNGLTAYGMFVKNEGSGQVTVNANNSYFNDNTASGTNAYAFGFQAKNTGTGTLIVNTNQSQFNGNTAAGESTESSGLYLLNDNSGTLIANIVDSEFTHNTTTESDSAITAGLYATNNSAGNMTLVLNSSRFNDNSSSNKAFGAELVNAGSGSLSTTANNSQFNRNSASTKSAGLYATNLSAGNFTLNTTSSQFNNNTGALGFGMAVHNSTEGTISVTNDNITAVGNTTQNIYIQN